MLSITDFGLQPKSASISIATPGLSATGLVLCASGRRLQVVSKMPDELRNKPQIPSERTRVFSMPGRVREIARPTNNLPDDPAFREPLWIENLEPRLLTQSARRRTALHLSAFGSFAEPPRSKKADTVPLAAFCHTDVSQSGDSGSMSKALCMPNSPSSHQGTRGGN